MSELYSEAVPGLDYEELDPVSERNTDGEPPLYLQHFLDGEAQEEIIEDVLDRYDIPKQLYFDAKRAVVLGSGPSTSLETVDRAREEYGLQPVSELLDGGENQ